jgi:acyl-homoserine-lactone acylase
MARGNPSGVWLASTVLLVLPGYEPTADIRADEPSVSALATKVTIRRDTFGVPHILAPTEEAAAFGHGYVTAEDHVLTLARLILQARGEEAAQFGEKFAEADFLVKQFHIYEGAERGYRLSPPWVQAILDGFAAGYNHYLQKHRDRLPAWVKPVTGADLLAHGRRVLILEFAMDREKLDRISRQAALGPIAQPQTLHGSNMWAIGKGRSASGKGILLGNPHLPWAGQFLFCEVHLTVPGKINVSGTGLIGSPVVGIGFNENLGWSHTVNLHSSDDVYELTLDPHDGHRYLYDGRSLPLRREVLTIQVKTDAGLVAREREVYWSHYGPVVKMAAGKAYAFKSANQQEYRFLEQWNLMGKARNLEEFRHVLDMQAAPMFNICYADKEGNVFYLFNGRFPDRPAGFDWSGVIPGNTSATEWNHLLPQSRLPSLVNPPGGYVQNCNSAPWYTNLQQIIDRHRFPPELTLNFNDLRQQLSLEMIEASPQLTLEQVRRDKFNTKLLLADRVKADVVKLARGCTVDGTSLDEAAEVLQAWDNTVGRESKGSVLFVDFWRKYRDKAPPCYAVAWDEHKPASTPSGIGYVTRARAALAAAVKEIKEKYGKLNVAWGDVHRLRRGKIDVPIGGLTGDFGAFRVIGYEDEKDGKFIARGGDSYVLAVEFTSPPTAYSIVAYSQSDDPASPHHTDQTVLFAAEKWKRAWFTEEEIAQHLERTYHP